jgi:hypothetical protein
LFAGMLLNQIAFLDDRIAQLSARGAGLTATMPEAWGIKADGTTGPDTGASPGARRRTPWPGPSSPRRP